MHRTSHSQATILLISALLAALLVPIPATAAGMAVNIANITKDPLFSKDTVHPVVSYGEHTDAEGFNHRIEHATAWIRSTTSFGPPEHWLTINDDTSWVFDSHDANRIVQAGLNLSFEASTAIHTTLDTNVRIDTTGNAFFRMGHPCVTDIGLRRIVRFNLDGAMRLHARLSGTTTNAGSSFKDMFGVITLVGGNFTLADRIYSFAGTTYRSTETTTFSGTGSGNGVDYRISGFADADGIDFTMDIEPSAPGTSQLLEIR